MRWVLGIVVLHMTAGLAIADEGWREVKAAIDARRNHFSCFSCDIATTHDYFAGLLIDTDSDGKLDDGAANPRVAEEHASLVVDLAKYSFRHTIADPIFSTVDNRFDIVNSVRVFDGADAFKFIPDGRTTFSHGRTLDLTRLSDKSPSFSGFARGPVFWMLGYFEPAAFVAKQPSSLAEFHWTQTGNDLEAEGPLDHGTVLIKFDRSKNYVPTQYHWVYQAGGRTIQHTYEVEYASLDGFWIVSTALFTSNRVNREFTVSNFRIADCEPAQFKVPDAFLKPGMLVGDGKQLNVVSPNNSLVPYVNGSPLPERPTSGWALTGTVVLCLVTVLFWYRYRPFSRV